MADTLDMKDTLNLPETAFSMKAKLNQKEPEMIRKWDEIGLYGKILQKRAGAPTFVLHDGPPYANGHIHLGTALNKILKDFIVKSMTMKGFLSPYIPGWDCHGLPIEIKVDKILGEKKKTLSIIQFRDECKAYALKFIDIQRKEFKRLGVFGQWDDPYLTIKPEYEGDVVGCLAAFQASGNVYKGLRPVHWCPSCQTALAEAEIEYKAKKSASIYVKFRVISDLSGKFPTLKGRDVSVIIWTTTPWTLPANLAIAFHPEYEYAAWEGGAGEVYITAKRLMPVVAEEIGVRDPRIVAEFPGKELEGLKARHPFINRDSLFVLADYVTLEDGTGAVHTAPGHGHEDYLTGLDYGLDIYTPVDAEGKFTPEVERYAGQNVFQANKTITRDMERDGSLLKEGEISHSYPHCWRCKNPVIFRATSQWFISMDKADLRQRALGEIRKVRWIPSWGEERIAGMVAGRPDWCISRQRMWGVPIPAFECRDCGNVLASEAITRRVADIFSRQGANTWYVMNAEELLPPGTACLKCGSSNLAKENNILDVWFESGSSHMILGKRPDLPWPSDVYIEGQDQYRGWFNSSLFIGVGVKNGSPYKTCITHGFVVDEQGRAMSKSQGNVIEPGTIIDQNGAEILRLWVAMLNYKEDARFGNEILQRLIEAYRKIRNTWRFLLGNLHDFSPDTDSVAAEERLPLDSWILQKSSELSRKALKAYADYEYHIVFHAIYDFFAVDLSALYLDILKDRLYCAGKSSSLRRSAQTALFRMLKDTLALMAPILPFTADEAWQAMPAFKDKAESVHLELFPQCQETWLDAATVEEFDRLMLVRGQVLKELENARAEKLIGNSLEAQIRLKVPPSHKELLEKYGADLAALFIVSSVVLVSYEGPDIQAAVEKAPGDKCRRCWNYSTHVGASPDYPQLCPRCEDVVRRMAE